MTQFFVIAVVLTVALADEFPLFPATTLGDGWASIAMLCAPYLAICLGLHAWVRFGINLRGSLTTPLHRADRAVAAARIGVLLVHAVAVLGFGLLDVVRSVIGDRVLLDEMLAAAPAIGALICTWLSMFSIESALAASRREGVMPTRFGVVVDHLRHDVLVFLLPIWVLLGWSEWINGTRFAVADWLLEAIRWAGVLVVLVGAPMVLRLLWRTSAFPPGPLLDRLSSLARSHKVRYAALRIWRPTAPIANAAVIGPVRFTRLILITESLLEHLPDNQIEAVMAHEVAHARLHHLPWLMAGLLTVMTMVWIGSWWAVRWIVTSLFGPEIDARTDDMLLAFALVPAGIVCLMIFGYISRRFEYQADAFAAAHFSAPHERITELGADTMAHALLHVAHINHIPVERKTFRHGSIGGRVERLYRLAGERRSSTPADRRVRLIKIGIGILTAGMVVWMALGG